MVCRCLLVSATKKTQIVLSRLCFIPLSFAWCDRSLVTAIKSQGKAGNSAKFEGRATRLSRQAGKSNDKAENIC